MHVVQMNVLAPARKLRLWPLRLMAVAVGQSPDAVEILTPWPSHLDAAAAAMAALAALLSTRTARASKASARLTMPSSTCTRLAASLALLSAIPLAVARNRAP